VLVVAVLAAALVGMLLGLRYAGAPDDVREARAAARRLANQANALTPASLDRSAVDRLALSVNELDGTMAPLRSLVIDDPLIGMLKAAPILGDQINAAGSLVVAGEALVEAAEIGLGLASEVVELREANLEDRSVPLMPGLVELMATSGTEADRVGELVVEAQAALDAIPDDVLPEIVEARDLVADPLTTYAPLLDAYIEHDDVIPGMLGWGDERRYLVLAQNPAEIRPSGGYSGTVGVITLRDGSIVEQRFRDVHELTRQPGLPFLEAPQPLAEYLLGQDQSWRLADANWAADFPEAAQESLRQYVIETGDEDIDGVIAITTYALDRLLEVVGPVEVPQYDVTVEPGDTTLTLLGATRGTPTSIEGRKEVLDVLARRLTSRLLSMPPARWTPTVEALEDIGSERMALAWMVDPDEQALVDDAGWDGRVRDDTGDYLYVVESNVSPTSKYNLVIDRADSLSVQLDGEGSAVNILRMDWQNDAGRPGEPYRSLRGFSNNEEGYYGSYVRVLVPDGAELVTASGQASEPIRSVQDVTGEAGRTSFANYLFMPPGESTLTYLWLMPEAAVRTEDGWRYELTVQKQPGARPMAQVVTIDLPDGAEVTEVSEGATVDGGRVRFEAALDQDLELFVEYRATD
jgi:hypothetical protein